MTNGYSRDRQPSVEEILGSIKRIIAENEDIQTGSRRARDARRANVEDRDDILDLDGAMVAEPNDQAEDDSPLDSIMADEAAKSVRHSLAALTAMSEPGARPQIVRSGETSLESLVREMLRPMLKDWLDDNLPAMVEDAVAREIRRITGGAKPR